MNTPDILYEDNHVLAVNKPAGMLVQGDKTRDLCVLDAMRAFIKERDSKPGAVFMGLPHRLDRPTSGALVLAKTSKSLSRLAAAFRNGETTKFYWAVTELVPDPPEGDRIDWLRKDGRSNSSRQVPSSAPGAKEARLRYRCITTLGRYTLIEVELLTGRHHQIRVQLSAMGSPIEGDQKYGLGRSNPLGGIHLHARRLEVPHPVREGRVVVVAPLPVGPIWNIFASQLGGEWMSGVFVDG